MATVDICPCSKDRHDIGLLRESPEVVNSLIIFDNVCDLISNAKRRLIPGFFPKSIMLFPLSELVSVSNPSLLTASLTVELSTSLAPRKLVRNSFDDFLRRLLILSSLEFSKNVVAKVEY